MTALAVYSNKGGVGKTVTAVNLAYLASQSGLNTLIVDLDPQSSSSYYFRVKPKIKRGAIGLARASKAIDKSIKGTNYQNLDLLPADFSHRNLDLVFAEFRRPEKRLKKAIAPLTKAYDLILFDCPPTINILVDNIFQTVDYILVPLPAATLSIRAYRQFLTFAKDKGFSLNNIMPFFSMVDRHGALQRTLAIEVWREFEGVLKTPVPYLPEVEQMGLRREPVPVFAPNSAAAQAYRALWAELKVHTGL